MDEGKFFVEDAEPPVTKTNSKGIIARSSLIKIKSRVGSGSGSKHACAFKGEYFCLA
jgi:hypothetical protein